MRYHVVWIEISLGITSRASYIETTDQPRSGQMAHKSGISMGSCTGKMGRPEKSLMAHNTGTGTVKR
jgi:hypothetical protein